jgi:hypothetical protein
MTVPEEPTNKEPRAVARWNAQYRARHGICGEPCDEHSGRVPGFCERDSRHLGMHSHLVRDGMRDRNGNPETRPGCSFGDHIPRPKKRRPQEVRGPF